MQVNGVELFGHPVEQARFGEFVDLGMKFKVFKNAAHGGREGGDVGAQVFSNVVLVPARSQGGAAR